MIKPTLVQPALPLAALLLSAACGGDSAGPTPDAKAAAPAERPAIAPAIIQPEEMADPAAPPSYEVAIASAAADHNNAKKRCAAQPESVRAQCEQEANAAFSDSRDDLERLRGNTP